MCSGSNRNTRCPLHGSHTRCVTLICLFPPIIRSGLNSGGAGRGSIRRQCNSFFCRSRVQRLHRRTPLLRGHFGATFIVFGHFLVLRCVLSCNTGRRNLTAIVSFNGNPFFFCHFNILFLFFLGVHVNRLLSEISALISVNDGTKF